MTNEKTPNRLELPIEYVEPEDGKLFTYANNVGYGFTPTDVRLIFGELIEYQDNKAIIEQRAQVTISWMQAKAMAIIVSRLVASHEREFGEIKVPLNYLPELG